MAFLVPSCLPYQPQFFRSGQIYGISHPHLMPWLQQLLQGASHSSHDTVRVYKQKPNCIYAMPSPAALTDTCSYVTVKHFGWRGKQHYVLSPLKSSKALKAYRTACYLLTLGLSTPVPLGAGVARRWGFIQSHLYVTEDIEHYVTLREYVTTLPDGPEGVKEVMELVATYTRRMHDGGLWHRDLFLANFLMTGTAGKRQLYLIDLNRTRRLPYMPVLLRALDLARMEWHARQPQFLALYCDGRFAASRLRWIIRLYQRWRDLRYRTLKIVNPLRRRLGLK